MPGRRTFVPRRKGADTTSALSERGTEARPGDRILAMPVERYSVASASPSGSADNWIFGTH